MKSYYAGKGTGVGGFRLLEQAIPEPASGQILIRVKAAAFNFRELMIINNGVYPLPVRDTFIPLSDGVGEVVALGKGVNMFKIGDRVAAVVFPNWADGPFQVDFADQLGGSIDGMLTEYKILDVSAAVHIPAHLEWEEAAAYPCAGITAWNALTGGSPLLAGETVLTMGTGGVSLFALQFAKLFGATVIATTSTPEKAALLKKLGAAEVVNYMDRPDWHLSVKEITKGRGADHIIEVGGAGTLECSLKSLSLNGQINLVGWLAKEKPLLDINNFAATVGNMRRIAAGHRRHHIEMNRAVEAGRSRPVIDRVFDFSEVKEAFNYYAAGTYLGKVLVTIP